MLAWVLGLIRKRNISLPSHDPEPPSSASSGTDSVSRPGGGVPKEGVGAVLNWEPEVTHSRARVPAGMAMAVTSPPFSVLQITCTTTSTAPSTALPHWVRRAEAPWESGSRGPSLWAAPAWCWVEPQ